MENFPGARLLFSCLNLRKQLNRTFDEKSLPYGEFLVLRFINNWGDADNVRAALLSDRLDVSRPAVSRILNSLEKRGYIARHIDDTDRRGVSIQITDTGREVLQSETHANAIKAQRIVTILGSDQTEQFITMLDQISDALKTISED